MIVPVSLFCLAAAMCILFAAACLSQFLVRVSRWIHATHGDDDA